MWSSAAKSPRQIDVPGHEGDPVPVNGAQVGVLEESDQEGLRGFLEGADGGTLQEQVWSDSVHYLGEKALEG